MEDDKLEKEIERVCAAHGLAVNNKWQHGLNGEDIANIARHFFNLGRESIKTERELERQLPKYYGD